MILAQYKILKARRQCFDSGTSNGSEYTILAITVREVTEYMIWSKYTE